MLETKLIIQSEVPHNCQIITGFMRLKELGYPVEIEDRTKKQEMSILGSPFLVAESTGGGR